MNESQCAVSLCETLVCSRANENHGLEITSSGIITFFSGNIISIFYDTGKSFEPWLGSLLGTSDAITSLSWCRGMESDGETPLNILVSDKSGHILLVDMISRKAIGYYTLDNGSYAIHTVWHQSSTSHFYVTTSKGEVLFFVFLHGQMNILWTVKVDFKIDFFQISPHNGRQIFVGSKSGEFAFITIDKNTFATTLSQTQKFNSELVDAKYYPFKQSTIVFVTRVTIVLYEVDKNIILPIYFKGTQQDPLITVYFPDPQQETAFLLVFQNHCHYHQSDTVDYSSTQNIYFLTPFEKTPSSVFKTAFSNKRLYVLGYGNTLQMFELRNKKFWCTRISRSICDVPSDFDCINNEKMCYVTQSGIIHVSDSKVSSAISKYYMFAGFSISHVVWVSSSSFLVSMKSKDTQKVLYIDISTFTIKSLLKPSMEKMGSTKPPLICVSPSKTLIALIIDTSILSFYSYKSDYISGSSSGSDNLNITSNNESTHSKNVPEFIKIEFVSNGTIGTFSSDTEFQTFSADGHGHKYKIDLRMTELIYPSRLSQLSSKPTKLPTACEVIGDYLCVGFENGDFGVYDWYGAPPQIFTTGDSPINNIVPSKDHSYCFITNGSSNSYRFTAERCFEMIYVPALNVKFLTSDVLLVHNKYKHSLTLSTKNKLQPILATISNILQKMPILQVTEQRRKNIIPSTKVSIEEEIEMLNKNMFFFLADAFSCSPNNNSYSALSTCANFDETRIQSYIKTIINLYERDNSSNMKLDVMRLHLVNQNKEKAFEMLISTDPRDPNFALNVIKASFIDMNTNSQQSSISPSVETLINGGKIQDAIDILLLTGQNVEAAKHLINYGAYSYAIVLAKTLMNQEEYKATIDKIVNAFFEEKRIKAGISILIACGMFEEAAKILEQFELPFPAAIVRCIIKGDDGKYFFDPEKFKM
ncbi:hypothetical protein TRFO_29136 [Tritrichomonas foetus]|uniref:Uncharacterized protein n=1 Tax=Tritrichomonas foetus TaxID=1144522 RepID=A0A1J4K1X1_9EUKA|nr:hypothetical protein TRFO_29136 [Tritrichomonas foetus]|eukprot:OHT03477.1 hypothetical protein TRFO_29136 [Tritrichomonas foetus]